VSGKACKVYTESHDIELVADKGLRTIGMDRNVGIDSANPFHDL